ncbi:SWIRM domain-containing protein [Cordyceps javanica]|uniref:SWIRM domain-containing protein n=1 Tax=Cordyceps javanica TaxID=43265 RepID=A0A545VKZ2_9HYPO|nr:SWIRM domain-containing protein [Cordyceps javanica]TQW02407.1 SWIRM domain-containing protein [Cordyceps javanica]
MATSMQRERPIAPMAPPPAPPKDHAKLNTTTSSLMSPPEPILDSFNHNHHGVNVPNAANVLGATASGKASSSPNPLLMSPPVSPYSKPIQPASNAPATPPNQLVKDPVLYPADESSPSSPPQQPLFAQTDITHGQPTIDNHLRTRPAGIFNHVSPPGIEEYELTLQFSLQFRTQLMKLVSKDPRAWLRRQREQLVADNKAIAQRYHPILPATRTVFAPKPARMRTDRVSKPQPAARPARNSLSSASPGVGGAASVARPAKRTSATPEPSRRIVAPNREDKDFDALPDYCPPIDSLPARANSLKVDWKGQPIDLSGDPHARLLHPDEVLLAGNLRLDCATYLTSKRRIFDRRLQCLRTGKEFRKTDAQQACKIDVNKASKLWTAFDKVGWLDSHWVRRFL